MRDRRAGVAIDQKPDKSDAMSELCRASYHEAGHPVAGRVLGLPCGGALIRPNASGYSITRPIHDVRDLRATLTAKLQVCLAGPEAERIAFGDADEAGDLRQIEHLRARYKILDIDVGRLRPRTRVLLRQHWNAVEAVAVALFNRRILLGLDIDEVFAAAR